MFLRFLSNSNKVYISSNYTSKYIYNIILGENISYIKSVNIDNKEYYELSSLIFLYQENTISIYDYVEKYTVLTVKIVEKFYKILKKYNYNANIII